MDLTQDDTKTPSPKHQLPSPSAQNAPSKTPSTKDTSSSSIDYIPKSPTFSTSPSTNGYLNSPMSPLPRVHPSPPTQKSRSIDITLTLSPITALDGQFNTPSPSPPIFGLPIPWNLLEAHRDSCCRLIKSYYRSDVSNFVSVKLSSERNYHLWKSQMLCLMKSHNMGGIVDKSLVSPRASNNETMDQYDSLLKGWIFGSASENVLDAVVDLVSAKDVWDKLKYPSTMQVLVIKKVCLAI
ncbi:hypothetical protein Tco_0312811 [Tanacetum coccineum]